MTPHTSSAPLEVVRFRVATLSASRSQLESRSMKSRRLFRLTPLMLLAIASATSSYAQQRTLNPTVAVREHPSSTVPTECEQGLEAAVPRAPQPLPAPLPETSSQIANQDVAQALRRVQAAAEADDRDSFVAALAEAVAAADTAPPGGQRDAAREALRVDSDIDRLWSFSLTSPTGAFFDAGSEGGALLTMMRQYRDFGRSILDSTLVVGGQTLYPTRESRRFLVQEAASRLLRLGIHSAPRAPRPPATVRTRPSEIETADAAPSKAPASTPSPREHNVPSATSAGSRRDTSSRSVAVAAHASGAPSKSSANSAKRRVASATARHAHTSRSVKTSAAPSGARNTSRRSGTPQPAGSNHVAAASKPQQPASPQAASSATTNVPSATSRMPANANAGSPPATNSASGAGSTTAAGREAAVSSSTTAVPATTRPASTSTQPALAPAASSVALSTATTATTGTTSTATTNSPTATSINGTAVDSMPASVETATSATSTATTTTGGGKLNLLFAIILIVAGIGLLVVFLRASD